jgi:hypothetical protein
MSSFVTFESRQISLCFCIYLLCVGDDLSPSDDADEDRQWEVQIYEGWVLYWDS